MATTAGNPLSEKAKAVLDYHRAVPDNDPRFASCLIETSCIKSLDELDAAYAELLKADELEAVDTGWEIDADTGIKFVRSFYQLPPGRPR
jgi:hypothetical protein